MKNPAFPLYSNDFLVDTLDWTIEEIGIYVRLLFYQWTNGSLPNDDNRLSRIAGCGVKKFRNNFKKCSPKFILNGQGKLQNKRLEEVRKEQEEYREKQMIAGKVGAEIRWKDHIKKDGNPNGDPISKPNSKNIALQSSSSSSIKEKNIYKEKKVKKGKDKPQRLIIPPEKEWVIKYCKERNNGVGPDKWYDHYLMNGWKVGKAGLPMKDWQAAVRTWEGETEQPSKLNESDGIIEKIRKGEL